MIALGLTVAAVVALIVWLLLNSDPPPGGALTGRFKRRVPRHDCRYHLPDPNSRPTGATAICADEECGALNVRYTYFDGFDDYTGYRFEYVDWKKVENE